jgi:DNA polymerase III delta prime subunit
MSSKNQLLSELLRPQQLSDLTLPQRDIDRLQKMIDSRSIMNMIFHGKPGLGKTSAARAITNSMKDCAPDSGVDVIEIEGSLRNGIDVVRDIERYASSFSLWNNSFPKLCIIDEADYLTGPAQAGLRHMIENWSQNCRFLFTVNNIKKISDPLRSRMKQVCFDISPVDQAGVIGRLITRYETKLPELGIQFDPKRLRELIGIYFPDLRSIANQVEFEFA